MCAHQIDPIKCRHSFFVLIFSLEYTRLMTHFSDIMERLLKDGLLSRASKDGYAVNKVKLSNIIVYHVLYCSSLK